MNIFAFSNELFLFSVNLWGIYSGPKRNQCILVKVCGYKVLSDVLKIELQFLRLYKLEMAL